ncbi:MAG: HlyC/CorC family transporter [Gammaproteobacteria bacterium]|nr:HlyC/CorC family transporter [Gammaproteobacteria bacterium]
MDGIPLSILYAALVVLLLLSTFFSGTETALMTLNRYRLRHLAKAGSYAAKLAEVLLRRPDRLLGVILLCNNLVNLTAASLATIIAYRVGGELGVALAPFILTFPVLIFSEVTPKTLAALYPEKVGLPATYIYRFLLFITYPFVFVVNLFANGLLRIFGIKATEVSASSLSREELRTVVMEAGRLIPQSHREMLLSILDLEKATVEDVMVPRSEIVGIDLEDDWATSLDLLKHSQHTRLLVYRDGIENVVGIIHLRKLLNHASADDLTQENFISAIQEPYYIPEGTPLHTQLLNFRVAKSRIGLVVDEYGDLQGLVTMEDILEEIVGEFTTDPATAHPEIVAEPKGSFLVNGTANIRTLNRTMNWDLPTDGPKTLNGLILEYLETIPQPGTGLKLADYPIEIVHTSENAVKTARIHPPPQGKPAAAENQ